MNTLVAVCHPLIGVLAMNIMGKSRDTESLLFAAQLLLIEAEYLLSTVKPHLSGINTARLILLNNAVKNLSDDYAKTEKA